MSARIDLKVDVDLADGGTVHLAAQADLAMLDSADLELIGGLLDIVGEHAKTKKLPDQGGAVDGPDGQGYTQPPSPSPEEPATDRDAGAAGAADDAPEAGPETPPATRQPSRRSGRRPAPTGSTGNGNGSKPAGFPDLGVRLLRALHDTGGEVFDPSGSATRKLMELAGAAHSLRYVSGVLATLAEAGHVTRTVTGTKCTRIALTDKGLAVVDTRPTVDLDDPPAPEPEPAAANGAPAPTSTSKGVASMCLTGQCRLCQAVTCTHDCHNGRRRAAA